MPVSCLIRRAGRCLALPTFSAFSAISALLGMTVLTLASAPAAACVVEPDLRPLQQRLAELPVAFLGTVESVDDGLLRFKVTQWVKGSAGSYFVLPAVPPACAHTFRPGERWFYAGPSLRDPSRRLGDGAQPLSRHLVRLDDHRLALAEWQRCDDSAQCVAVDNGCLPSAVHRDHGRAARERSWARGGDPRALECDVRVRADIVLACVDRRCGAWQLTPTVTLR